MSPETSPRTNDWAVGDHCGLAFPAHPAALRSGGSAFLTRAFRAFGTLTPDNRVTRITRFEEVSGGSTGRKALLSLDYARPRPDLPADLFVKFSRDLDDPVRDVGRTQMEPEVRFAALSRAPGFPIAVPATVFADFHRETGTGILVTERIRFGDNGIEEQHHKCLDYGMPDQPGHYRALLTALARLAGWDRSGAAPAALTGEFPIDLRAATVGDRPPLRTDKVDRQIRRLAEFAAAHPGLLPADVRSPRFLSTLARQAPEFVRHEPAVWRHLAANPDHMALCHWNANVDNAWFWRDGGGEVRCGLLDWGCVSRMNVAMALWGAMSAAETTLWNDRFDTELAPLFTAELRRSGGPDLDASELSRQVMLYAGIMGITWLLDVPALIRARLGSPAREMTRFDPAIRDDESLRAPLQMLTNVLNLWRRNDFGALLSEIRGGYQATGSS